MKGLRKLVSILLTAILVFAMVPTSVFAAPMGVALASIYAHLDEAFRDKLEEEGSYLSIGIVEFHVEYDGTYYGMTASSATADSTEFLTALPWKLGTKNYKTKFLDKITGVTAILSDRNQAYLARDQFTIESWLGGPFKTELHLEFKLAPKEETPDADAQKLKLQYVVCDNDPHNQDEGFMKEQGKKVINANGGFAYLLNDTLYADAQCTTVYTPPVHVSTGESKNHQYDLCGCGWTIKLQSDNQVYIYYKDHDGSCGTDPEEPVVDYQVIHHYQTGPSQYKIVEGETGILDEALSEEELEALKTSEESDDYDEMVYYVSRRMVAEKSSKENIHYTIDIYYDLYKVAYSINHVYGLDKSKAESINSEKTYEEIWNAIQQGEFDKTKYEGDNYIAVQRTEEQHTIQDKVLTYNFQIVYQQTIKEYVNLSYNANVPNDVVVTGLPEGTSVEKGSNSKIQDGKDMARDDSGWIFVGWSLDDPTGNIVRDKEIKMDQSHTLYAQWETMNQNGTALVLNYYNGEYSDFNRVVVQDVADLAMTKVASKTTVKDEKPYQLDRIYFEKQDGVLSEPVKTPVFSDQLGKAIDLKDTIYSLEKNATYVIYVNYVTPQPTEATLTVQHYLTVYDPDGAVISEGALEGGGQKIVQIGKTVKAVDYKLDNGYEYINAKLGDAVVEETPEIKAGDNGTLTLYYAQHLPKAPLNVIHHYGKIVDGAFQQDDLKPETVEVLNGKTLKANDTVNYADLTLNEQNGYLVDVERSDKTLILSKDSNTFNLYYTKNAEDPGENPNPDPNPNPNPGGDGGNSGGGSGGGNPDRGNTVIINPNEVPLDGLLPENIEDLNVPLAAPSEQVEDIKDEETPLAASPRTGDSSNPIAVAAVMLVSGLFAAVLGKRKKEEQ